MGDGEEDGGKPIKAWKGGARHETDFKLQDRNDNRETRMAQARRVAGNESCMGKVVRTMIERILLPLCMSAWFLLTGIGALVAAIAYAKSFVDDEPDAKPNNDNDNDRA